MSEIAPIPQEILEATIATPEKVSESLINSFLDEIMKKFEADKQHQFVNNQVFNLRKSLQDQLSDEALERYFLREDSVEADLDKSIAQVRAQVVTTAYERLNEQIKTRRSNVGTLVLTHLRDAFKTEFPEYFPGE